MKVQSKCAAALLSLIFATSALAAENDLSIGWIARLPRIDYVWKSTNPTREGWPAEGSAVTWQANVRWLGAEPIQGVTYRWTIDGAEVKSGTLDFAAQSLVKTELPWTWTFERHEIAFEIDSAHHLIETEKRNNKLLIDSNALGVGIYVEKTFWDGIRPTLKASRIGAVTFDDWMQIQTRRFNEMAKYAIYPETPNGVLDRWRIDEIHVVVDGSLPLAPPYSEARDWGGGDNNATLYPNVLDHTVDMQWGFPAITVGFWGKPEATPWVMTIGNSLVHEWSHARTMIDVYAWDLDQAGDVIDLNPFPPPLFGDDWYYKTPETGMMNFNWGTIDRFTAAAMNQMAGRRASQGNYNEPWDLGWFLNDLPAQNRVRLLREDGSPMANRTVYVHRPTGDPIDWQFNTAKAYALTYRGAGTKMTTDSAGHLLLPQNPFADGRIYAFVEKSNGVVILEIDDGGPLRKWAFLDSLEFNLAYWRGNKELADYDVKVGGPLCNDKLGGARLPDPEALITTPNVTFNLLMDVGAPYELWYAVDGGPPVKVDIPPITKQRENPHDVTLPIPLGHIVWWTVNTVATPPCLPLRSSTFAFEHQLPGGRRRGAGR